MWTEFLFVFHVAQLKYSVLLSLQLWLCKIPPSLCWEFTGDCGGGWNQDVNQRRWPTCHRLASWGLNPCCHPEDSSFSRVRKKYIFSMPMHSMPSGYGIVWTFQLLLLMYTITIMLLSYPETLSKPWSKNMFLFTLEIKKNIVSVCFDCDLCTGTSRWCKPWRTAWAWWWSL